MSFETFPQYPPVDGELVDRIVCKLKSQGIFDQFRKDCLADVDTKPAYQNLQQRVNGTVATFLATQTWQQDLNKTQLRESLRRHVQQGFLEVGVDRIVDQVVNPKVFTVFMPKVEDVVYDCLGIEKPKHPPPLNNLLSGRKLTLLDLLPKDLDPVSPDSDNLSFDDDETKDETNNNENSSKLDLSQDSQVSGISDLSSHMGDSFKDIQENNIDSNTVKTVSSIKENSTEPHFDNFENLSEKIKQAEIGGHNSTTSPLPEEQDNTEPKVTSEVEQNLQKDNRDDNLMEIDSVSNSTFEDAKILTSKIIKEDTCSRTFSEDSRSCSSFNDKFKKDKSQSVVVGTSENSMDKSEVDTPCKELSSNKEVKISPVNDYVDIKSEEKVMENKELRKTDELKDKKPRESSSSKTAKSSRPNDSKHRSSNDKKDDIKQSKEKTYKEDKDKEKYNKDDKDRSSKHKDDRHHSSKDKYKDKDKNDRSREKDSEKKKDRSDYKDLSEKDKKNDKDKYKDKDRNDKEKTRNDKENHKYEKDKSRSEKDKHEKNKKEKDKYESKEKDRDANEKDRDKNEKDRSRERDRRKSEKDYKNEKNKESRPVDEKIREDKKKDSKKYDKGSSSSSTKKDDNNKNEMKDRSKRSDESAKDKTPNSKSGRNEEEKRERKRKSERCNDETKLKEARRSWDRDSSGGNGKGHGSQKSNNSECKASSSSASSKEKRTGESSNQQKANERKLEPVSEAEEPSDVDKILMKINSSIEESQNIQSDEQAIKKPKIARNIFEIRKIMQARKNIARQAFMQDKRRKEIMDSVEEVDVADSPSTTEHPPRGNPKIREENKENIKAGQMDKLKNPKVGPMKGKFNGFLESDIEQARNSLQIFRSHFSNFCTSMGMEILPTENIERVNYTKIDFSDDLLDDNLNKLKPKPVSLERRKTYPDDNQVSKAVENIMSGKNGCYVLLQDCRSHEVVEAMRNASQPPLNKSTSKQTPSKPQQNSGTDDGDSNRTSSEKNVKILDRIFKKENLSSSVVRPVPQVLNCSVDVGTEIISHTSQEQAKQQGASAKKSAIRTPPPKEQLTQDNKDEEAFSPVADVTTALNTYLNDSMEILPSISLTEAMLDDLMQQSSIIVEDETFADSDDSIHEYESVKKKEVSEESGFQKEENRISDDVTDSSDAVIIPSDDSHDEPRSKRIANAINSSTCDIFSRNRDSNEETSEVKVIKRRNQRLCRSASQRYDSTDLYKPRPVLPQNSKRVRTPRSVSSEDVSTRGLFESTPSRKRAR